MINYWEYLVFKEYLVPNIVRNYVITTYWEYSFFFVSVNIVINNMLGFKKINIVINYQKYLVLNIVINCQEYLILLGLYHGYEMDYEFDT